MSSCLHPSPTFVSASRNVSDPEPRAGLTAPRLSASSPPPGPSKESSHIGCPLRTASSARPTAASSPRGGSQPSWCSTRTAAGLAAAAAPSPLPLPQRLHRADARPVHTPPLLRHPTAHPQSKKVLCPYAARRGRISIDPSVTGVGTGVHPLSAPQIYLFFHRRFLCPQIDLVLHLGF